MTWEKCGRAYLRAGCCAIALYFSLTQAQGQRYNFRVFGESQGLTDLGINTLLQDRTGFVWVGTNNGLFRFDGHRFRRFGVSAGLPAHEVSSLFETREGTLWVATEAGLSRRYEDRFVTVDSAGAAPERGPETIAEDAVHHGIYVATSRGLLRILASGGREWIAGTEGKTVWSVFTDRTGVTWYAQTAGVCAIASSVTRCYGAAAGAPPDSWGGLVVDHAGEVWVRSAQRLISLAPGEKTFARRDQGLPYAVGIGALSLDASGNVLVPTGAGLALRSPGRGDGRAWSIMGADAGLVVSSVPWATVDREGLIWIAMRGGGLACWLGAGEWQNWTTHEGLKSDEIWAITRDRNGNLLAGTTYGVSMFEHDRFRNVIEIRDRLARDRVSSIVPEQDDSLWIGTSPRGLFRYEKASGRLRHFDEKDGIPAETVYSLAASPDGSIWAGCLKGLYRGVRGPDGWIFHKENTGAVHDAEYFHQILLDRHGRLWAAGSEGLAMWQSGAWTRITAGGSPIGRLGGRLAEAPDGAIWLAGRAASGLNRITREGDRWRVESVSEPKEFGPQATYFLGFDREGNLWRGTGLGVYALVRGRWVRYIRDDGLVWDDTDANAFFADADNSVWIGTTRGLSHHFRVSSGIPARAPAEIVRVTSGTQSVDAPRNFRQHEGDGSINIEFAALTFRRPKSIRFRYRLAGIDASWIETSDWEARYASIPPGKYTFEVESGAWDGGWFGRPAVMSLVVVGPWWRSRWVAIFLAAFGVTGILLFWRYREREHRRRQRDLSVAVRQRTDELQVERTRERDSNAILEMIVGNHGVSAVLDAIGSLIRSHSGAEMCCFILRRGDTQTVAADAGLPRAWRTALANPSVIPFEVWRSGLISGFATDPVWRTLTAALGESTPRFIVSRLIGHAGSPLGIVLMFYATAPLLRSAETFDGPVRLARIAIEHATMYENLLRQAQHDPLTGLPNRLRLEECLELAIRDCDASGRKLAIFYIDLDRFKEINDRLSHRAGDLYLRETAERMKAAVRSEDIVGRIGGDEFNVIVPMIPDRGTAEQIAFRLLEQIRRPITIEGVEFSGTASLGIAIYPDDSTSADELQRKADAAMYCAKSAGKNRFESCASAAALIGPHGMNDEIRSALAENRFRLDYQPKVNAAGRIVGIEALLRLDHATLGEISPTRFIPVAEQAGLIVPVGKWVLNEVCRQIADWSRRGIPVEPVAVNVSPVQLCRDDFAELTQATLELHDVHPGLLELEVTESVLVDKSDVARQQMQALRRVGVRFSIDDFGAGHSSFSYLHQLDVDAIKLERSFVHSIESDSSARKLVRAIIGMTESMGIRVIAEGVETETQRSLLLAAGCELMQGYYFARPQPAHRIESLLLDNDRPEGGIAQLKRAIELAGTS